MWWIIIGAVIALVVMIVLMVMFTGKSNTLQGGLLDCTSKGGSCGKTQVECTSAAVGGTWSEVFECSGQKGCCFESKKVGETSTG